MSKFRTYFFSLLGVLLIVGSLAAQAPTGKITGTVSDDQGFPLPGVAVDADSPTLVGIASTTTDINGVFRLFGLPSGRYTIRFTLENFNTVVRKDIIVRVEQSIRVNIEMTPGTIEEEITVIGQSPLVDVKSTTKGMTLTKEMFQMLPRGRNFDTLVTAVPGVNQEPYLGGLSVDGASGAENMYYIDGMDITNMDQGSRDQSAAFEFVDEVQIVASGYQAEFGGSMGGVINVITRAGGNEFHGELIGYYSGSRLNGTERDSLRLDPLDVNKAEYVNYQTGDGLDAALGKDDVNRWEVGFSLGGYIIKDRL
ncbi:MAG: TonB-dependent receptor, partial [Candidatus Aminicenantes bacterium]|nr:TonB-dependent receptor [Candidatus Aminicenantes bacterium]